TPPLGGARGPALRRARTAAAAAAGRDPAPAARAGRGQHRGVRAPRSRPGHALPRAGRAGLERRAHRRRSGRSAPAPGERAGVTAAAAFLGEARGRLLPASIPLRFFGAAVLFHFLAWVALLAGAGATAGFAGGLGLPLAALHLVTLGILA